MKLAVTSLLADQLILPVELGSSIKVTVQGLVIPQLLPFKAVGLTDQSGGGGGVCEGVGDGDGEGVGVVPITVSVMLTCALPPSEVILIVAE